MNDYSHQLRGPHYKVPTALIAVVEWPIGMALISFCIASLYFGFTAEASWATATSGATGILGLLMLGQRRDTFTSTQWSIVSLVTAILFWGWCIVATDAIAKWSLVPAASILGLFLPAALLLPYIKPREPSSDYKMKFAAEASTDEFYEDIAHLWKGQQTRLLGIPHLICAGFRLPSEVARELNFLIVGAIGSGKTTALKQQMESVLPYVHPENQLKVVVHDAKNDLMPFLYAVKSKEAQIHTMNPYDQRAYAWDMAADCITVEDSQNMAIAIVHMRSGSQADDYFVAMSRLLTGNTMVALTDNRGQDWDLLDVVQTILDTSLRERILGMSPEARLVVENLGSHETAENNMSSIYSFFGSLIPLACLMRRHALSGRKLSINQWIQSPSILVLGGKAKPASPLAALNRVIVERLQNVLLDATLNPESEDNRTFLFLDEFASLGRLDAMVELLRLGRDRGLCSVLCFQTISDLTKAFGDEDTWKALLGHIGNKVFLRINDPPTAEWAAKQIGMQPLDPSTSKSWNSQTGDTTITVGDGGQRYYDYVIHAGRFTCLPVVKGVGVHGFFRTGLSRLVPPVCIPWQQVISSPAADEVSPIAPCPKEWQRLDPAWNKASTTELHFQQSRPQLDEAWFDSFLESLTSISGECNSQE